MQRHRALCRSPLGITERADRFGTLTAMPDDERTEDGLAEDDGPVLSGFGIASAALGLLSVAAIVLAVIIWSGHRADADERRYQTEVLDTAAEVDHRTGQHEQGRHRRQSAEAARRHGR